MGDSSLTRLVRFDGPVHLDRTLRRWQIYKRDPTERLVDGRFWTAGRFETGPASVGVTRAAEAACEIIACGPGAEEALAKAAAFVGADDEGSDLREVPAVADHPLLGPLARRFPGIRFGRTERLLDRLVPVILGQKVTGKGALRSYRDLLRRTSEAAPGDVPGLWLPPDLARVRELSYADFHPMGVERKRAKIVIETVRRAGRLQRMVEREPEGLEALMLALPGIGPWTVASTLGVVLGDPDAVAVGDYHLKNMVVHAFTGRARGEDSEMLELLAPFAGYRGRVLALLAAAGVGAPRFGPRMPVRDIRGE